MRRLLVVLLLAMSGLVMTQTATHAACSCVSRQLPKQVQAAEAIFTGVVMSSAKSEDGSAMTYKVKVGESLKDEVDSPAQVRTSTRRNGCPVDEMLVDRRYLVMGTVQGNAIEVDSCGGTALLTPDLLLDVQKQLGDSGSIGQPQAPTKATITRVDDSEPPSFARLAAPGGALAIIGLLGLVLLGRKAGQP
jgi:hypothetical protein